MQSLRQPLTPLFTQRDAITHVSIEEYLVASLDQPLMHLTGQRTILASVTDKDPGHLPPPPTHHTPTTDHSATPPTTHTVRSAPVPTANHHSTGPTRD
jgi:hypothetical protein